VLLHPKGFALGPRKITVSTAGVVPKIGALLAAVPVNLAVSLHSPVDAVRDELVPINRRFPLAVLFDALAGLETVSARRPVFFEYTLMRGKNDSEEDARRLVRWLRRVPAKLNLIPMNAHPDAPYQAPDEATLERFAAGVAASGITVTVRRPRGQDIDAACGQLALRAARRVA
jgi:23S rRNA (adenine2503-C2)-methyltransferase